MFRKDKGYVYDVSSIQWIYELCHVRAFVEVVMYEWRAARAARAA